MVGSGNDTGIQSDCPGAAQPLHLPLLQDPQQLGLKSQLQVAYLVQKDAAVLRQLKFSGPVLRGPGKSAFYVSEQLALQQSGRDGGAVDPDKGAVCPWAVPVDGVGEQLFAGSALAGEQNGGPLSGSLHPLPDAGAEGGGRADQVLKAVDRPV